MCGDRTGSLMSWLGCMSGSRPVCLAERRVRARRYVSGLAALERKHGWTLAEQAGEVSPHWMQRLLRKAD